MKNVAFHNLGCKVNYYEMEVMRQNLQENGYKIVPFDEKADIYIINTCSVTNVADQKSRQMLHRAKKKNPDAVVVAVGCYVQTGGDVLEKDEAVDLLIGNNRKKDLVPILEQFLYEREQTKLQEPLQTRPQILLKNSQSRRAESLNQQKARMLLDNVPDMTAPQPYEQMTLLAPGGHIRTDVKIQDGCNQFCSYCIIPYARGRVRSRRPEDVLTEVKNLVSAGSREIVLTGIHISSYGTDLGDTNLLFLLRQLQEIPDLLRIRLGSLEPGIITEDFVNGIRALPAVCPHFHLSLQSGCAETLARMNRHYTPDEYEGKVALLRSAYENPAITTDVIAGFPGETKQEFAETSAFLEKIGYADVHIFPYSKRAGTRAAAMDHQVPEPEKKRRAECLISLGKEMTTAYRKRFLGQQEEILIEGEKTRDGHRVLFGHTARYVPATIETDGMRPDENFSDQIFSGRVDGINPDGSLCIKKVDKH